MNVILFSCAVSPTHVPILPTLVEEIAQIKVFEKSLSLSLQ